MRILLVHHNTLNTGDDAIVESSIAQMREAFPDCSIVLESGNPEVSTKQFKDIEVVERLFSVRGIKHTPKTFSVSFVVKNIPFLVKTCFAAATSQLFVRFGIGSSFFPILREYNKADLVISVAGDSISEDYAWFLRFYEMWMLKKLKKPLILYAQSIGPFTNWRVAYARKYLSMTTAIFARDHKTVDLMREYGVSVPVLKTADVAIALKPQSTERAQAVIKDRKLDKDVVGIVIRTPKYTQTGSAYDEYLTGMSKVFTYIVSSGKRPLFIASIPDDAIAAIAFAKKFGANARILKLYNYLPSEAKVILAELGMVISPRMHPVVLTSSMKVPVIGIGKEFKMLEYLSFIGLDELHVKMFPFDARSLINAIQKIFKEDKAIRAKLQKTLSPALKSSYDNGLFAKEVYKQIRSA